jgi:vacuolar-type H+-ATPase subunit E/Vma4
MKGLGSVAAVVAAILEEADAEVDAVDREAAAAIAALPPAPGDDAAPEDAAAIAAARERARLAVAHEDWEDARAALSDREAWVTRAIEVGRCRLLTLDAVAVRRDQLAALAREAIDRLPEGPVEVLVAECDVALLDDDWKKATFGSGEGARVSIAVGAIEGGLIARAAGGRVQFDNTWPARAERFHAAWRSALADLYEKGART